MTDQMRSALYGINKFMFFSWNYAMTEIERNGRKICLPKFIVEAKWSCDLDHIISKWYRLKGERTRQLRLLASLLC